MDYPYLSNAPIREAIIDIRVKRLSGFDVMDFMSLADKLKDQFPISEERKAYSAEIMLGPEATGVKEKASELDAIIYKSYDNKELIQLSKDGFTFNRLEPYTRWEDIMSKAKMAWELYVEVSSPVIITRIASRYINNILIPRNERLENYIQNVPKIPSSGQSFLINSLSRNTLIEPKSEIIVHLTQTVESGKEEVAAIIIDIDAFKQKEFEIEGSFFWNDFEQLREMKNRLFFNSLTNKAINQYK